MIQIQHAFIDESSAGRRKTILFVIDNLALGGAQQFVVMLVKKIVAQGDRVIVCLLQPQMDLAPRLSEVEVKIVCLSRPRPSIKSAFAFIRYVIGGLHAVSDIVRKERVDIVHAHLSDAEFIALTAGILCRVPMLVTTVHTPSLLPERGDWSLRNTLRIYVSRLLYKQTDHVIAVSDEVADNLLSVFGIVPQQLEIIENCVEIHARPEQPDVVRRQLGIPSGHRVLAAVGRLEPVKNCSMLLQAVAHLGRHDVITLVVGIGSLEQELRHKAQALGIGDRVLFLGLRNDVAELLSIVDVFVLPSKYEGTSLALLEAMAAGKAIVATDIPGNRKPLTNGRNALLVPLDDVGEMALAIARILNDPELAQCLSSQARSEVHQRYSVDSVLDRHESLWSSQRRRAWVFLKPRSFFCTG